jgi:hypothetical protein
MAVSTATHWDVRPATGNDNNGGGFKQGATGVDYSQQASPQYALSGIASVGSGNTILSAAAATDMVGNIAQVLSGTNFTTGFFEITSVIAGVSITFSTRGDGTAICSGVGASGVINIGGSLATIAVIGLQTYSDGFNGNVVWVKGTLTVTSNLQAQSSVAYAGYGTTHGDNTRAAITTATNSTELFTWGNVYQAKFENFDFSNTAATREKGFDPSNNWAMQFRNCSFDGFTYAYFGGKPYVKGDQENNVAFIDCEVKNCTTTDGALQFYDPRNVLIDGCYIHDNAGEGVIVDGGNGNPGSIVCEHTIFDSNANNGFLVKTSAAGGRPARCYGFYSCDFYGNGANGLKIENTTYQDTLRVKNSIFYGNGAFGVYRDTTTDLLLFMYGNSNAYGANTSGARGGMWPASADGSDVTLTADPFTNAAAGDFSLNSTAGGGAACKGVGHEGL